MAFRQTDRIRDSVFPLVEVAPGAHGGTADFTGLLGTGFLIGSRGWAVTARHALAGAQDIRALFVHPEGLWTALPVIDVETHPSEDVAALRLPGEGWGSIFDLAVTDVRSSFEYCTWGYPSDVLYEVVEAGIAMPRPDLAFVAGHVRRRLRNLNLPKVRGVLLAELTVPAGSGFSGAPVLGRRVSPWSVAGVYLGERTSDDVQVGYAALAEAFATWEPASVGRSLRAEAANKTVPPSADG